MSVEVPGGARAPTGTGPPPPVERRPTSRRSRGALERALREASYEVLPLRGAEASVVEHVPRTVPLTVTVTEAKGLTPPLERGASAPLRRRPVGGGWCFRPRRCAGPAGELNGHRAPPR